MVYFVLDNYSWECGLSQNVVEILSFIPSKKTYFPPSCPQLQITFWLMVEIYAHFFSVMRLCLAWSCWQRECHRHPVKITGYCQGYCLSHNLQVKLCCWIHCILMSSNTQRSSSWLSRCFMPTDKLYVSLHATRREK